MTFPPFVCEYWCWRRQMSRAVAKRVDVDVGMITTEPRDWYLEFYPI